MIIQSLYDNCVHEPNSGEVDHGFSITVNYHDSLILVDGGASADIFGRNASHFGVDLTKIDTAILSHAHYDHASGIDELLRQNPNVPLFLPPDPFLGSPHSTDAQKIAYHMQHRIGFRYRNAKQEFVKNHKSIGPGIDLIVTESKLMGYFSDYPPKPRRMGLPELSLLLTLENGNGLLISGCSHSGISTIVKSAISYSGKPVDFVLGGFHLGSYPEDVVQRAAAELKELGVVHVAPTHCTGKSATSVFADVFGADFVAFGLGARITVS